jgi:hypothetical protein
MNAYFRSGLVCLVVTVVCVAHWLGRTGRTTADLPPAMWSVLIFTPILATVVVGTFGSKAKVPWNWTKTIVFSFAGCLAVMIAFAAAMGVYGWSLARNTEESLDAVMDSYASEAVQRAKAEHEVTLDFSTDSLAELERLLEKVHQRHATNALDQQTLGLESQLWGAYIGGVFKKITPAEWRRDSKTAGQGSFPLVFKNGSEFFPCGWVWKRIQNGKEDNVMFKFAVALESFTKGAGSITNNPGVTVLPP